MRNFWYIFGLLLAVPTAALAQAQDPCAFVPGGCQPDGQALIYNAASSLGNFMLIGAGALGVVFVVVGAFMMLVSFGDESRITTGRNAVIYSIAGLIISLAAQAMVSFAAVRIIASGAPTDQDSTLITLYAEVVGTVVSILNAVFAIVMVVAGLRLVIAHGKQEDLTKARSAVIYAIVGALIINSAHALVRGILDIGF